MQEWINEEGEEDVCSAVNNKLGGMEEKLKKKEFCSMESKMSGVSNRVAERTEEVDEIKDNLMRFGTCKTCGVSSCGVHLDSGRHNWWRCGVNVAVVNRCKRVTCS